MARVAALSLLPIVAGLLPSLPGQGGAGSLAPPLGAPEVAAAARAAGLQWTAAEVDQALGQARRAVAGYARMRAVDLPNGVAPAWTLPRGVPVGWMPPQPAEILLPEGEAPAAPQDLHFATVAQLAALIRSREVSCLDVTQLFLLRLEEVDERLHCVVNLLTKRALARAAELDRMLDAGTWLGPLHGIPFGAKDLLAAKGAPTTWGAAPFREQLIDADAGVIRALEAQGAVLVAKLSLGALAMGDVWYGGTTRTPWNPERGSSGSSAGPAAATAAGALPIAVGSETLGSILSPARRCGNTALRPTHGLVPMDGAMVLSWSMDKLGPMGRSADDIAWMFAAMAPELGIEGAGYRFHWPVDLKPAELVVGYVPGDFRGVGEGELPPVVAELKALGCRIQPVEWAVTGPIREATVMLRCEAAAAFDAFTRSGQDDQLTRQNDSAWPNLFRAARLVPAVEYLQAQRVRALLREDVDEALAGIDVLVHPSHQRLSLFNLTGHPTGVAPRGPGREDRAPAAIGFTGQRFGEAAVLVVMSAWQRATGHGAERPPRFR